MIIERTKKEVIFRLPSSINVDDLQDMTDLLQFKELAKKSKATQKDVDSMVKKIKKGRWGNTKSKLGLRGLLLTQTSLSVPFSIQIAG